MPKFKENPSPLKYGKKSSGFKMKSPFKFMGFFMPKTMKTKGNQNIDINPGALGQMGMPSMVGSNEIGIGGRPLGMKGNNTNF